MFSAIYVKIHYTCEGRNITLSSILDIVLSGVSGGVTG